MYYYITKLLNEVDNCWTSNGVWPSAEFLVKYQYIILANFVIFMADNLNDEYKIRLAKLENIRKEGVNPYPEKFDKIQPLAEILSLALGTKIKTAGRLLTIRAMGKIVFCEYYS